MFWNVLECNTLAYVARLMSPSGMLNGGDNTYNGRPLFRGAIMDSGSVIPYARVDAPQAQRVYDSVVRSAGCEGSGDTLACLRALSYQDYLNAATSVPALFDYNGGQLS